LKALRAWESELVCAFAVATQHAATAIDVITLANSMFIDPNGISQIPIPEPRLHYHFRRQFVGIGPR
jgi:hypothetical protein